MITLLDADLVIDDQAGYTDLAFSQIAVADLVVINKTDLVSPRQIEDVRQKVEAIVPGARILETTFGGAKQFVDALQRPSRPRGICHLDLSQSSGMVF
jgi:G3E family GTPase